MARAPAKPKTPSKRGALAAAAPPKEAHPALAPRAPLPFSRIIGHQRALRVLTAAASSGRVHHAWVFAGPMGVGKRTVAEAFAAVLLDPTSRVRPSGFVEPDADSEIGALLATGTHPDMHLIVKELATYSDDPRVRAAKQTTIAKDVLDAHLLAPIARAASVRSDSAASKVFIVDEAELLDRSTSNATSQNALLKTLEEPPPGSVIILVTAQEERLLPTIRSRCQRIGFSPLDDDEMDRWMDASDRALAKADRLLLRPFAGGSPGRAALALDTGLLEWARETQPALDATALGRYRPDLAQGLAQFLELWKNAVVKRMSEMNPALTQRELDAAESEAERDAPRHLVAWLLSWAQQRLRESANAGVADARALRDIDLISRAERVMFAKVQSTFAIEDLVAGLSAP